MKIRKGRRGLLNLGQTCFLNVILQSFLANPLLRNYFLSDKHNHRLCARRKDGKDCTCCEMDVLFSEVGIGYSFSISSGPAPHANSSGLFGERSTSRPHNLPVHDVACFIRTFRLRATRRPRMLHLRPQSDPCNIAGKDRIILHLHSPLNFRWTPTE